MNIGTAEIIGGAGLALFFAEVAVFTVKAWRRMLKQPEIRVGDRVDYKGNRGVVCQYEIRERVGTYALVRFDACMETRSYWIGHWININELTLIRTGLDVMLELVDE